MNHPALFGKKTVSIAGAILLCGSMGLAQAGDSGGRMPGQDMSSQMNGISQGQASPADKVFVSEAMQGSMAEVELGKLTLQKSNNEQVKQFAQRMIDDHTKLNDQMKPIAQQVGALVLNQPSKRDKATMKQLQALSGSDYDKAYIKGMVKGHKHDLSVFQAEASAGQDQTVRDAANQGSRVIAQHLQMIEQIAKDQNVAIAGE